MRLFLSLVLMSAFGLGQMALAEPRKIAVEAVDVLVPDSTWENVRLTEAKAYTKTYVHWLQEHAVRIRNQDKFANLIPRTIAQDTVEQIKQRAATECLASFSDDDLSRLVLEVSQMSPTEQKSVASGTLQYEVGLKLVGCLFGIILQSQTTFRDEDRVPPLNQSGFLADILETSGVADFPNRIVRKSILQGLRDGTISTTNRIDVATH